jgi:hypothetical protein
VLEKNVKNTMKKDGVFKRAKKERLILKILKNRSHSCLCYIIRHNEFVVGILEGAISEKRPC